MKNLIYCLSLLICFGISQKSFSQENNFKSRLKANIFLGGQYSLLSYQSPTIMPGPEYFKSFEIGIGADYFITNNYSFGVSASYYNYQRRQVYGDDHLGPAYYRGASLNNNMLRFSIQNKYYFKVGNKLFIPIEIPLTYFHGSLNKEILNYQENINENQNQKHNNQNGITSSLKAGLSYIYKDRWEFNFSIPFINYVGVNHIPDSHFTNNRSLIVKNHNIKLLGQLNGFNNPLNLTISYFIK